MPLYEYECSVCGHRFELIQRFADPPAERCAACGKGPIHKLLSAPAIHFKGTGWYVTDYANKKSDGSPKTDGSTSAADTPPPATPSGTPGDAKPGTTGDAKAGTTGDAKPSSSGGSKPAQDSSQKTEDRRQKTE
jgi:putative FmdB family regulatory protein